MKDSICDFDVVIYYHVRLNVAPYFNDKRNHCLLLTAEYMILLFNSSNISLEIHLGDLDILMLLKTVVKKLVAGRPALYLTAGCEHI